VELDNGAAFESRFHVIEGSKCPCLLSCSACRLLSDELGGLGIFSSPTPAAVAANASAPLPSYCAVVPPSSSGPRSTAMVSNSEYGEAASSSQHRSTAVRAVEQGPRPERKEAEALGHDVVAVHPVQVVHCPPRSEVVVPVHAPGYQSDFWPITSFPSLHFASTVFHMCPDVREDQRTLLVSCINTGVEEVVLHPDDQVGWAEDTARNPVVAVHDMSHMFAMPAASEGEDPAEMLIAWLQQPNMHSPSDQAIADKLWEKLQHLPEEERVLTHRVCCRHLAVFREMSSPAQIPPVALPTNFDAPLRSAPYRVAPPLQAKLKELLDGMVKSGVVSPCMSSDVTSPVVLVVKKDGGLRFCVDYRRLNRRLMDDPYPHAVDC
jgi:hypothetical protein